MKKYLKLLIITHCLSEYYLLQVGCLTVIPYVRSLHEVLPLFQNKPSDDWMEGPELPHFSILDCSKCSLLRVKPVFHSSQKLTRKLTTSSFKYCDWMKVLAASLPVSLYAMSGKCLFQLTPTCTKHAQVKELNQSVTRHKELKFVKIQTLL